jgi:hypothetical protein
MRTRVLAFILFTLFIVGASPVKAPAQEDHELQAVQVEGGAVVLNFNLARAQREAISDALKKAVETAVAQLLSPELMASKSQVLKTKIYSVADTYIQTYKILSETPSQKIYGVNLIATIDFTALKADLKASSLVVAEEIKKERMVSMTVQGFRNYPIYARFIHTLSRDIDVVKNVYIREARRGMVRLDVAVTGPLTVLADKLGKTGQFSFHLNQVGDRRLEINLLD